MHKYITSYIDWFDHELHMQQVFADNIVEALIQTLKIHGFEYNEEHLPTEEEVKQFAFSGDCMVGAFRIS